MKEVSVRKCSKVMFAVITLTDEFFSHISKSHSISSCLQCVYEDCNIVKSLLGHLWSQPGFDSAYHRNLMIFRLLLQWLDWQAWRFSLQIFITSAITARWLFKAGLFTSFNISENLLIRFALHQNLEYLQQGKKIVELDVFCNISFHKLCLRRNLVVINKVSKNTFQVLIISYKTRLIKTFVNSRNNILFITPIAHPQKETKFRSRISDNLNLICRNEAVKEQILKNANAYRHVEWLRHSENRVDAISIIYARKTKLTKTWDNRKFALCLIGALLFTQRLQLLVWMQKEKKKNPCEIIGGVIAQPAP